MGELPHFSTPSALIVLVMCHFHTPNGAPRIAKQHFVLMGNGVHVYTRTPSLHEGTFGKFPSCRRHRPNFLFVKYFGNTSLRVFADDGVKRLCIHPGKIYMLRLQVILVLSGLQYYVLTGHGSTLNVTRELLLHA